MRLPAKPAAVAIQLLLAAGLAAAPEAAPSPGSPWELRAGWERLDMPAPGERMGLLGLGFLHRWEGGLKGGLAGYGAMRGERGGFITAGLAGGWDLELRPGLRAEAGLFMGAGGAGRAAVGGGLMLRGHLGLALRLGHGWYGLEYARVRFPNGAIDSRQLAFQMTLPFSIPGLSLEEGTPRAAWPREDLPEGFSLSATGRRYAPRAGTRRLGGGEDRDTVDLVGAELDLDLGGGPFAFLEMAAACRGRADGYMEALLGLGWRQPLGPEGRWALVGRCGAGPAGGGTLDFGGGLALKAGLELEHRSPRGYLLALGGGLVSAPGASYRAWTAGVRAGRSFASPRPGEPWAVGAWAFRAACQRLEAPQRGGGARSLPMEGVSLKLDRDLAAGLYLTGQGFFAATGGAGGYAQGLLGLGWRSPELLPRGPRLVLEAAAGAGGGGGVDTRGGLILQPSLGLEQRLAPGLHLQIMGGRVKAPKGRLDTGLLELGLAWRFGLPEAP